VLALTAGSAHADPAPTEEVPPGLRGPRMGFTPGIGAGFVGFTGNTGYPSFVFATAIQIEALLELTRWGFFARGGFLSAGQSGFWTAPTAAVGTQYRLVGDGEERWGFVVRAGVVYERWTAVPLAESCAIYYFIPNSCQAFQAPTTTTPGAPVVAAQSQITADSVGVLAGVRLELPLEPVYIAFDAELSAAADVDQSIPGAAIEGQLVLTFAMRDHPIRRKGPQKFEPRSRIRF